VFSKILTGTRPPVKNDGVFKERTPSDLNPRTSLRAMVAVCALVLTGWSLYAAQTVFAPLAFALFIIALVWPVQQRLQSSVPKLLALAVTMAVTLLVVGFFSVLVAWALGRVMRFVSSDASRIQETYGALVQWFEGHGIVVAELWANYFTSARLLQLAQDVAGRVNAIASFSIVILIYVLLGLLEVDDMREKLGAGRFAETGEKILTGARNTAIKLRRYMGIRTLMSVMTGLLVWLFVGFAGLPLAAEWGVLAFALNYIPFIGPFIATVFPTLFAVAYFQSFEKVGLIFICLNIIQFVVGSYLEPRFAGGAVSISPFVVLFAVFFWAFLWGIPGAFIGVPIVIAILTFCEEFPSARWLADVFGSPDEKATDA
jgi:predicted PurR-regulated permease PerM